MQYFKVILSAFAIALTCACATVGETGRKQFIMLNETQEVQMGAESFAQVKAQSRIIKNTAAASQVERVGRKIAAVSGKNYNWEFILIDDAQINAFALPGGKVAVYSGILQITRDDAGLAVVISHEIAHALARHGAERMTQGNLLDIGGSILGAYTNSQLAAALYGVGANVGVALPFSRKQEIEADEIGIMLMGKAGYNPESALLFWQRMASMSQNNTSAFLSTHPKDDVRIKEIQNKLPKAKQYYYATGGR